MEGKNIKVYGTLINQTLNTDSSMRDSQHNDLIAVAYQLFDERFTPKKGSGANGAVINIDRYQDIINKRLTALSYDPNGDLTSLYSNLYVSGDTNIGRDLTVEGDTTFEGNVNITGNINLNIGLNDLNDVTLSTMAIGLVLRYNGNKWVNAKLSLSDLLMPAASNGLVLKFNGTEWVAGTDESGATKLSDLSDVDSSVDSAADGSVLKYDESTGKWKAVDESSTPSSDGYIYRTQMAHLRRKASIFAGYEVGANTIGGTDNINPSKDTFGIKYPNGTHRDVYVSDDIVLENGEFIYSSQVIADFNTKGQYVYPSGTPIQQGSAGSYTMNVNGHTNTWPSGANTYYITPGTRKSISPTLAYSSTGSDVGGIGITGSIGINISYNNGAAAPAYTTDPNYDRYSDPSLRVTLTFLITPGNNPIEATSDNYRSKITNATEVARTIDSSGNISFYVAMIEGYARGYSSTWPYMHMTTDFYKYNYSDDGRTIIYTSLTENDVKSKMTFIQVPYGLAYASILYDKSAITLPDSISIKVVTCKKAS